jgi:hypothetical protein
MICESRCIIIVWIHLKGQKTNFDSSRSQCTSRHRIHDVKDRALQATEQPGSYGALKNNVILPRLIKGIGGYDRTTPVIQKEL